MSARQTGLPGLERAPVEARASAYTIVRCVCSTKVVVGAGVSAVACPTCRQIVSGALVEVSRG